jgi:hypothetical protein
MRRLAALLATWSLVAGVARAAESLEGWTIRPLPVSETVSALPNGMLSHPEYLPEGLPVRAEGAVPFVVDWKPAPRLRDRLGLVVYSAGVVGTNALKRVERAVLIDKSAKHAIGDALWHLESLHGYEELQPKWFWSPGRVKVVTPYREEDREWTLPEPEAKP